jgi:transcriptional regulator with XRE-family HTH domain
LNPHVKAEAEAFRRVVGANVRRLRQARKLTQRELAGLAGISAHYVSRIEAGRANLRATTLGALARALEAEPATLLTEPNGTNRTE